MILSVSWERFSETVIQARFDDVWAEKAEGNQDKEGIPSSGVKQARLYSDLLRALKGEHLSALGSQQRKP